MQVRVARNALCYATLPWRCNAHFSCDIRHFSDESHSTVTKIAQRKCKNNIQLSCKLSKVVLQNFKWLGTFFKKEKKSGKNLLGTFCQWFREKLDFVTYHLNLIRIFSQWNRIGQQVSFHCYLPRNMFAFHLGRNNSSNPQIMIICKVSGWSKHLLNPLKTT